MVVVINTMQINKLSVVETFRKIDHAEYVIIEEENCFSVSLMEVPRSFA